MSSDENSSEPTITSKISEAEEKKDQLIQKISFLKDKLGSYQQVSDDANEIACSACPSLKLSYEICMQKWYNNQFLAGQATNLPCEVEYKVYNACVMV